MKLDAEQSVGEAYASLIFDRRRALSRTLDGIVRPTDKLVCEIGSGHGHFLTAYALKHPHEVCIGIDIIGERVARAVRKRDRAKLNHLHFVHAEAGLFIDTLPLGASISKVFILFPDPWPKTRHHKHRVIQSDFLERLASRMSADAELFFRTDHLPYFEYAKKSVQGHPKWKMTEQSWPFEHETVFQQRALQYYSLSAGRRH